MIKKLLFSLILMSSVGNSTYACCKSKTVEQVHQEMLARINRNTVTSQPMEIADYKIDHTTHHTIPYLPLITFMQYLHGQTQCKAKEADLTQLTLDLMKDAGIDLPVQGSSVGKQAAAARDLFAILLNEAMTPQQMDAVIAKCPCFEEERRWRAEQAAEKSAKTVVVAKEEGKR